MHFELMQKIEWKISEASTKTQTFVAPILDLEEKEDKSLLMKLLIKASDVSNPAKPHATYQLWADRIMVEFYNQGDKERARGLPISAYCDRQNPELASCQMGFIK